ncbi:MAG: hypothetical protein AMJ84_04835 [Acidithiobacillales bacterium SM23_46]|nr:MAG: hypothetical protein AMJ84_04835 [Acidithiobacillales bacterium SM23_46]
MRFRQTVVYSDAAVAMIDGKRVMKKHLNHAIKEGLRAGVVHWRRNFMREHFFKMAFHKYHYQPRKPRQRMSRLGRAVQKLQAARERHLVKTGRSRRAVLARKNAPVRFRKKGGLMGAEHELGAPPYFYAYKTGAPDKADELTRHTPMQDIGLMKAFNKRMQYELERLTRGRRRTKRM